jgi:uncharacterized protein with WD repeat
VCVWCFPWAPQVWDVAAESVVVQLARKGITKESWPIVQWTGDGSTCFYAVTNTVHAFSRADNFSSEWPPSAGCTHACKAALTFHSAQHQQHRPCLCEARLGIA